MSDLYLNHEYTDILKIFGGYNVNLTLQLDFIHKDVFNTETLMTESWHMNMLSSDLHKQGISVHTVKFWVVY